MPSFTKPQPQAMGPNQPHSDEALALPLLMKITEVMRALAISRRTVYELVKNKRLHLIRIGIRGSRIRTDEVLALAGTTFRPLRIPTLRNQSKDEATAQSMLDEASIGESIK